LNEMLAPVRARRHELENDLPTVHRVLAEGAEKAHTIAAVTYDRAANAMGLLPPVAD
jgi:tryptophanyl-tRNA synthetase